MNSNQNKCMNPEDRWFTEGPYMLNNRTLHSPSGLKLKPWKFKVDGAINGKGGGGGAGEVEAYKQQFMVCRSQRVSSVIVLQIILSPPNHNC